MALPTTQRLLGNQENLNLIRLSHALGSITYTAPASLVKTVSGPATPEALAASTTYFQALTVTGLNAAKTNNAATVYLGVAGAHDLVVSPGETVGITAPRNKVFNLVNFQLKVDAANDGIRGIYA